jgi:hypothetical protein
MKNKALIITAVIVVSVIVVIYMVRKNKEAPAEKNANSDNSDKRISDLQNKLSSDQLKKILGIDKWYRDKGTSRDLQAVAWDAFKTHGHITDPERRFLLERNYTIEEIAAAI